MRWWGWGEDAAAITLPGPAAHLLREQLDLSLPPVGQAGEERGRRVELADVRLPEPSLPEAARRALAEAVGSENVLDGTEERLAHAAGRSYPDLVRLRRGDASGAPDAVVLPNSGEQVAAVLRACAGAGVAVIPFGGGTSVVGGVEALRGRHAAAITLDLRRMDRVLGVDRTSLTASLEPGLMGPQLERLLAAEGLTLGHFPQSFQFSTLGGWVATRSAGQASTGYGRIDELVQSLRCESPAGPLATRDVPATAAGPSLRELLVGSEGTLGVITQATVRVRPAPAERHYEGWSFRSFEDGVEALRALEQRRAAPDVARLSDAEETRLTMALGSTGSTAERAGRAYLRLRGHEGGCLAFTGFEGPGEDVSRRRGRCASILRGAGAVSLGERPGRSWLRGRFSAPYLRDELLDRGVMVETLETATTWSGLHGLYATVGGALRESLAARSTPPAVMCHVSHLYPSGASLYFTFLARQEQGAELEQWRGAKTAACDAIHAAGGTITHHHAVGTDHAPWMEAEVGALGIEALRAVKERVDPTGVMNPGKLLPGA
ncbi:MAG TPA: FAD-binding oxidoreductase [Thermoleophilaceae bacterium]|nr:FAD-binding oxidoreductase [Thermoleophilaceae bacterium]